MNVTLTNRGLLRAVLLAFALFLAYRFLATVAAILLLLAAALLLAVILSAPIEALHRRGLSRPVATGLMVLGVLVVLGLGGYLLFPVLANQASQVASDLPGALSQLAERARSFAQSYGFQPGGGGGSSSSLSSIASSVLGGIFGLFSSLASLVTGLLVVLLVPIYLVAQPEPAVRFFARFSRPSAVGGSGRCSRRSVRAFSVGSRAGSCRWRSSPSSRRSPCTS